MKIEFVGNLLFFTTQNSRISFASDLPEGLLQNNIQVFVNVKTLSDILVLWAFGQ
jgi:hypothetical protein